MSPSWSPSALSILKNIYSSETSRTRDKTETEPIAQLFFIQNLETVATFICANSFALLMVCFT